mmetsp:Transcript_2871/g.3881  ORF Transcript_2871/g.3881 Transcript_2871/m.3881 type:complete len:181 (-) Transcript_2871:435-977(-)
MIDGTFLVSEFSLTGNTSILFILNVLVFIYCFIGLAIICDTFLILSLETLCVRWHLREDVAGATFMALGSAAPEIIVNALSTFEATDPDNSKTTNLGVGAIMGSGCIAFTFIPGLCALAADSSQPLQLKRRPLLRDITTYSIALFSLCYFFRDSKISLFESRCFFNCNSQVCYYKRACLR